MVEFLSLVGYPRGPDFQALQEIAQLGVQLIEGGEYTLLAHRVLGKGTQSVVFLGKLEQKLVAVKVLRGDSVRSDMEHEAQMLKLANQVGVGPKLLAYAKRVLVMEVVQGVPLERHKKLSDDELVTCVERSLEQAKALDSISLDHGELSRPLRHVFYEKAKGAVIIDFESASTKRKPHNFNSLFSFYFVKKGEIQERVKRLLQPPIISVTKYSLEPCSTSKWKT